MDEIIIRQATFADLPQLYIFEQGVINAERPFDITLKPDPLHYYDFTELITADHIELVVAEADGKLVASGYARIEKAKHFYKHEVHAYLGFMYVVPECRGRGINKLIIEALKHWSEMQKVMELRLEVYYYNTPAIKAYEKIGFSKSLIQMRLGLDDDPVN